MPSPFAVRSTAIPNCPTGRSQTSALVCRELERLNIPYTVLPGMHGVVGMISSGREGPTVALRADMDALPIQEQTGSRLPLKRRA